MESELSIIKRKLAAMEARCDRLENQLKDERTFGTELNCQIELLSLLESMSHKLDPKVIGGYDQRHFCGNACRNLRHEITTLRHLARQRLSALYEPIQDALK